MRKLSKNTLDAIKNCIKDDMQSIVDSDQSLSDTLEIVDACVDNAVVESSESGKYSIQAQISVHNIKTDGNHTILVSYDIIDDGIESIDTKEECKHMIKECMDTQKDISASTKKSYSKPFKRIIASSRRSYIKAAGEDEDDGIFVDDMDSDDIVDSIDDISDDIDDMRDSLEDLAEDDTNIEVDNNISNHYIAECDACKGIFISAVIESDQELDHITGVCPLCGKETDQYLYWVIKDVDYEESEENRL